MRVQSTSAALCGFLCSAGVGLACPVAGDLETSSIEIRDEEGVVMTHTRSAETVIVEVDYGDDTGAIEARAAGLYTMRVDLTEGGQIIDGETMTNSYDAALPKPAPGLTFKTASTLAVGSIVTDWVLTYDMGEQTVQKIADCTFDVIEIEISMQGPLAPPQVERYIYFTDFGIAHLAWSGVGNMSIPSGPVAIRVVDKTNE